jgi:tetratricopeptide (TPR) repeat protein
LAEIFQYLVVFLLAVWTARLAMTKERNAWAWGGAALILGLLPWHLFHLFGVLPALVLLFIKLPSDAPAVPTDRLACARCAKSHTDGQHFCTGCGWDLSESYSPELPDEGQPFPARPQAQTTVPSTGVAQPTETTEPTESATVETPAETESPTTADAPVAEITPDSVLAQDAEPIAAPETPEPEPEKEHVPWGTFDIGVAPTAAVMVSRGIERFDAGKFQEAIDQFTKAIALDPNYAEAWQRRAEAYAELGRPKLAEDDRRHLQGLDPSSSPG